MHMNGSYTWRTCMVGIIFLLKPDIYFFNNETRFQLLLSKGIKYNHYNTKHIGSKSTRLQTTIMLGEGGPGPRPPPWIN